MLLSLLPDRIVSAVSRIDVSKLQEIRLRLNAPIMINMMGEYYYLSAYGAEIYSSNALVCTRPDIDYVISKASNNSIHTINDQLVNGYITYTGGIRIGVAGEIVSVGDRVKTIKNIQSLMIRVPHEVNNCALPALRFVQYGTSIYNTLVLSPAGAGKTTFVRDLAKQILRINSKINILIVDERSEITGISGGVALFNNANCDILSNCKKGYAFDNGIRSMRPDVIITDELSISDFASIENAMTCGVKVIATIHANSIFDLKNKPDLCAIIDKKMFDRYILLGSSNKPGEIVNIYDANLESIGQ
ncbi:MAG: hypothetical protein E7361_02485 [Clostridiales bacterium]|nr:hypothetical protein [Clostridiales bacterium]